MRPSTNYSVGTTVSPSISSCSRLQSLLSATAICAASSQGQKMIYYMLIRHLILWFWIMELSALKYNIVHNLRSRIYLRMIQLSILSLQMLYTTVNKLKDHQRPMIYSTTIPDVLSNRTCKDQESRDFTCSSILYTGSTGSWSCADFKILHFFFFFL